MAAPLTNTTNTTVSAVNTLAEELHLSLKNSLENSHSTFLLQLTNSPFLFFLTLVIAAFAISWLFTWLSKTVIKAFTKRTETDLDDKLLARLQQPFAWFLFLFFFSIALVPLSLSNRLAAMTNTLLVSGNILLIAVMVNRVFAVLVDHYGHKITSKTESRVDDQILPLLRRIIAVVIYLIAALVILGTWGVQIAPLLAGAGIAGIALAFAMQESLKNIFGGVSLAFDNAYGLGDRIKLPDGTVGKVVDMSLRSTKIRTFTGDLIVVPNGIIANSQFQTYAQPTIETAVVIPFGVAYGTDVEKVRKIVFDSLVGIEHLFEDKDRDMITKVEFIEMGPYSLNLRVMFWVNDYTKSWDAKLEATKRVHDVLVKNKIDIPFPTQTLYLHQRKE